MQEYLLYLETALNIFLLSIEGDSTGAIELHMDVTLPASQVRMRDDFPFVQNGNLSMRYQRFSACHTQP